MYEKYGNMSGEILLMESRGNAKYIGRRHIGVEQVHSEIRFHGNGDPSETNFYTNSAEKHGFNAIFHNYQLEWTPCMYKRRAYQLTEQTIFRKN